MRNRQTRLVPRRIAVSSAAPTVSPNSGCARSGSGPYNMDRGRGRGRFQRLADGRCIGKRQDDTDDARAETAEQHLIERGNKVDALVGPVGIGRHREDRHQAAADHEGQQAVEDRVARAEPADPAGAEADRSLFGGADRFADSGCARSGSGPYDMDRGRGRGRFQRLADGRCIGKRQDDTDDARAETAEQHLIERGNKVDALVGPVGIGRHREDRHQAAADHESQQAIEDRVARAEPADPAGAEADRSLFGRADRFADSHRGRPTGGVAMFPGGGFCCEIVHSSLLRLLVVLPDMGAANL